MGHQAIVYGRIQGLKGENIDLYNARILEEIADTDEDWPFLTRHMFSMARRKMEWDADRGVYKARVIHFAASFKDEPGQNSHWAHWLSKFELVLSKMIWNSAKVHLEADFSNEICHLYLADWDAIREKIQADYPDDLRELLVNVNDMTVAELKNTFHSGEKMTWFREQREYGKPTWLL